MKKELFKKIIELMQEQDVIDEKVGKSLELVTDSWVVFNVNNKRYEALRLVLKDIFNDESDWINYWFYELDGGKKAKKGTVTDKEGNDIPLNTVDDLYDLLTNK